MPVTFFRSFLALLLGLLVGLGGVAPAAATTRMQWADLPEPEAAGFERAIGPHRWRFPQDLGPHPEFQTEWWYYTGNLESAEGRPFGFQFTVFRQTLKPGAPQGTSQWRSPQVFSAHFTVSDIAADRFLHQERFSRGSLGLAGASAEPYGVWLNDWQIRSQPDGSVRIQAATEEAEIDLEVRQSREPVLQGRDGLSQKGPEPGNASYYYSLIQQPTSGTLRVGESRFAVHGISWKDHEIFTNSLAAGTIGWDWFSAQFDDGSALMLYDLRHADGSREPQSGGRWIGAAGAGGRGPEEELKAADLNLEVIERWRSPHSGATYPAAWRLRIPRLDLDLEIRPLMADQELTTSSATYWEGAMRYAGHKGATPLQGRGYGELTGYADRLDTRLAARAR